MPLGEHFWQPDIGELGLKLTGSSRPWHWKNRYLPEPYLEGSRTEESTQLPEYIRTIESIHILAFPQNEYAFVQSENRQSVCSAQANGGHIRVNCENNFAGQLVVMENYFPGWVARCNSERLVLDPRSAWLTVWLPAGNNECQFNYRPWDVYVGLFLTLIGIGLAVFLWRKAEQPLPPD